MKEKITIAILVAMMVFFCAAVIGYSAERTEEQVVLEIKATLYDLEQLQKQAAPLNEKANALRKELKVLQDAAAAKAEADKPPAKAEEPQKPAPETTPQR